MSFEHAARRRKVSALVRAISFLDQPPSADDVAEWPPRTWSLLAQAATLLDGKTVHPPNSAETIDAIVREMRTAERRSA
jgi:hypothetical protein